MKFQIVLVGLIAVAVTSCNVSKDGCYTGFNSNPKHTIATVSNNAELYDEKEAAERIRVMPNEGIQPCGITDERIRHAKHTGSTSVNTLPEHAKQKITTLMADNLRALAPTASTRLAKRVIYSSAERIEKMDFTKEYKPTLRDKIKAKIYSKFFMDKEARAAAMAGADILAIVSLATGIFSFAYYAFPLGIAAIVTGAIALRRGTGRRGMAIAGIVLGAIAVAFWSGFFII